MSDSTLRRWLDGETKIPLAAEYRDIETKPAKKRPPRVGDRERLDGFLKLYFKCAVVLCVLLATR